MSKKSLVLALSILSASLAGCGDKLPPFPDDVEYKLVDVKHMKLHRYYLPTKRGENAKYVGSQPLSLEAINKMYVVPPRSQSKVENYIGKVEDLVLQGCN